MCYIWLNGTYLFLLTSAYMRNAHTNFTAMAGKQDNKNKDAAKAGKGVQTSKGPQIPVASAPSDSTQQRVSPKEITMKLGTSLKALGKKMPKIPGMAKLGGGGRGDGTKPLLLAIFFIKYANWTEFCRRVPNGMITNIFGDGLPQTKENRVMFIVGPGAEGPQTLVHQCLWSEIPAWCKEVHNFDSVVSEVATKTCNIGAYTLPAGYAAIPAYEENDKADKNLASFRKNADLAEHYAKLATETADADKKAEYEGMAKYYGEANKYAGFCCATAENALAVATSVRNFYALNPEFVNEFTELDTWTAVYGQEEVADIPNAAWETTREYAAEQAAEKAAASTEA